MIKVGVVGATGYTGEELIEVLLRNNSIELTSLTAIVEKTEKFSVLFPRFRGKTELVCSNLDIDEVCSKTDIVFLALPHTVSMKIAPEFMKKGKKIIDLSADYRLPKEVYEKWYNTSHADIENLPKYVYGLPEINRKKIKEASLISNPGCFPTGIILSLFPVIDKIKKEGLDVIIDSKTGVTGAGRKALIPILFGEVDGNFKTYKVNEHQHMPEMEYILSQVAGEKVTINFIPHLLPVRRGIFSTIYIKHKGLPSGEEIHKIYEDRYKDEFFVRVRPYGTMPELKDVVGNNFCDIGVKVAGGLLIIVSVIDNLLKGASGQAVQNMNIMCGIEETAGLL